MPVDTAGATLWDAAFSPDGTLLAIGDDDRLHPLLAFRSRFPGAESGAGITFGTAGITADVVYALAFSPNGSYLAAGGGATRRQPRLQSGGVHAHRRDPQRREPLSSHDVTSHCASRHRETPSAGGEVDCGKVFMCTTERRPAAIGKSP